MSAHLAARRGRLTELMKANDLGAIAVVPGPNFFYLTGLDFHLMERPTLAVFTADGAVLAVMPELERLKWSASFGDADTFYWQDHEGYSDAFAKLSEALGADRFGVEGQRMRAFEYQQLVDVLPQGAVTDAEFLFGQLRISKDSDELDVIKSAIRISETAIGETLDEITIGMSERHIKSVLKGRLLANGADTFAFNPIVLTGPHSANPHGSSGDTPIKAGDALLFDFGAGLGGYAADITRTYFVGHCDDDQAAFYETVLAANTHGREIASPQLSAHDLDVAVTDVLAKSPFAEFIVHKTGHGLGLAVHEAPQIMQGNHITLPVGAVITIEPGLYDPSRLGVRIEDDVLITPDGAQSLTELSRDLQIIAA